MSRERNEWTISVETLVPVVRQHRKKAFLLISCVS